MLRSVLLALALLAFPLTATAQDSPRAILVLDASGSMWGQIDGVNKIVIAREVIGGLLDTLPGELELGLMAYGHRRKGDCTDIEMLSEPGLDRGAIAAAVNALNPKGKTPLSAAVIEAAKALRYTEEAATVILVSDGIETCNYDPCAVGRELEAAGINFTAHVIGFDVADPAARAQLQCLADETGGRFLSADNADELASALDAVVTVEPMPVSTVVTFRAIDGPNGPEITEGLVWNIATEAAGPIIVNDTAATELLDIFPSEGRAEVLRIGDEASAEATFTVAPGSDAMVVTLVLPPYQPPATLEAPTSAPAGSQVPVSWTGPGGDRDYIAIADADMSRSQWREYAYVRDGEANVASLRMPPEPGVYELRYILSEGGKVLATRPIEVTPLTVTLTAPENPVIGLVSQVPWSGPDYPRDYIAVSRAGSDDGQYETYAYTEAGNPAAVTMPAVAGDYELRYVLGGSGHVVARLPITVADAESAVTGPAEAPAGATIDVGWTGPDAKNDYVSIAKVGARDGAYDGYSYTKDGNPVRLRLPQEPGDYELRYVLSQDSTVLARAPITLTPVTATLDAPAEAPAGSELRVGWSGPDYDRDFVAIAEVGSRDSDYISYAYTGNGNPARFAAPTAPGTYELRYIANDNGTAVIARTPIAITTVAASIETAPTALAGSEISVAFTGPGEQKDLIVIARPSDTAINYEVYDYARSGSPLLLAAPLEAGPWEARYLLGGPNGKIIARAPIEVTMPVATLTAPDTAIAGGDIEVAFTGPAFRKDMIVIARPRDTAPNHKVDDNARSGNPLTLTVPLEAGPWEVRYLLGGSSGVILARAPLEVTMPTATVSGPTTAMAGGEIEVTYTGPMSRDDLIAIARPTAKASEFEESRKVNYGNPVTLDVPDEAGDWELRYQTGGTYGVIIARMPMTVTAP